MYTITIRKKYQGGFILKRSKKITSALLGLALALSLVFAGNLNMDGFNNEGSTVNFIDGHPVDVTF